MCLSGFDFLPFDKEQGFALVERLRANASAHGASVAQVAIAWLLKKPGVTSVLIGASKESQLEDNLGASELSLSETELSVLDEASPHVAYYPRWFNDRLRDPALDRALGA